MSEKAAEQILIPNKFIALALHLVIVTMSIFSYHDNILIAYPDLTNVSDENYVGGEVSFLACSILSLIFLAVEVIILFVGVTMFRERHNLFVSTLHYLGAIFWCAFVYQQWQFSSIWILWLLFSLLPLTAEVFAVISVCRK